MSRSRELSREEEDIYNALTARTPETLIPLRSLKDYGSGSCQISTTR